MSTFLKEEFDKAGYKNHEAIEGILVVEDFLTEEEHLFFMGLIEKATEEDWAVHYRSHLKIFCMEKFGRDDVENLVAEGKYEITKGWDDKNLGIAEYAETVKLNQKLNNLIHKNHSDISLGGFGTVQRMQEGVELKAHTDEHTDPSVKYAAVIYLNDDYVDGEIFWPNKDIQLKPKPRSLVVFPGNDEFHHGVKHVGKGPIRYVLPGFIRIDDFYTYNKY